MQRPIIIAHRGTSGHAKQNTIESFRKAIEIGVDMIEFDVRRTKDKVLIAYHDRSIHEKPINQLTYREIENGFQSKQIHVPTIEEILDLAKGKTKIDLEIKEEGYENKLVELVAMYFDEGEFVLTSFNDSSLRTIKSNYPRVKVGLILGKPKPEKYIKTRLLELFPIKRCKMAKADFLVPHFRFLKFGFLRRAEKNNKPVYVWTVNDERMILRFLNENRVEAIITDRPDVAVAMKNRVFLTSRH